ncbi:MAG TPA: RES family NAD+ phosphorylase [Candidatus Competibacteraceae bacterium]|nr:RES family NAD+ phosphorylase [Candidatus Competibacteraceae bacterium]
MRLPPPLAELDWPKQHRIVPAHFPPINLFESILDPGELELAYEIESLTNDRLRDEVGDLRLVTPQDRVCGPGSSPLMAAFTHIGHPSRFSDGRYGVYYAARELETAIAETRYHRERFLRLTAEPSCEIAMRVYVGRVQKPLHDVRGPDYAALHAPDDYGPAQRFAAALREQGSWGLAYRSVRRPGGECIAALRPPALSIPVQGPHLRYVWDGRTQRITEVLEVRQWSAEAER